MKRRIATALATAGAALTLTAVVPSVQAATTGNASVRDTRVNPAIMQAAAFTEIGNYHSGKCLDVPGYSTTKGAWIGQYTCKKSSNQEWKPIYVNSAYGIFNIINEHSRQCLDVQGGRSANGTHIIQWSPCRPGDLAQRWSSFLTANRNYFVFMNLGSHTCMQVNGASQSNGAKVSAWECMNELANHKPLPHHFWWSWASLPT